MIINKFISFLIMILVMGGTLHAKERVLVAGSSDIPTKNMTTPSLLYSHENPWSFQFATKHKEKIIAGYSGYLTGALATWIMAASLHPGGILMGFLLTPVGGALGSAIGVFTQGDMMDEKGSFSSTTKGGFLGSGFGSLLWVIPGGPLFSPLVTSLISVEEYNKTSQKKEAPFSLNKHYNISMNPVGTFWALAKTKGLAKEVGTPLLFEFERKLDNHFVWALEGIYQNQHIEASQQYWIDGFQEEISEWRQNVYGITGKIRWYKNHSLDGPYFGFGASLFYSSVQTIHGIPNDWGIYDGTGYFIKPLIEVGYQAYFFNHLTLRMGWTAGPIISMNTKGLHHTTLQEVSSLSTFILNSIVLRGGISW